MKRRNLNHLRLVYYPDPLLKKTCAEVTAFGLDVRALAERMLEVMNELKGVGLAAPQVGMLQRLFVCNITGEPSDNLICVNPRFAQLDGAADGEEGCLSLPAVLVTMRRATSVVMHAFTPEGEPFERTGVDLEARVWQHEADHLDGRLIVDTMSTSDEIVNRRLLKQLKAKWAERQT